MGDDENEVCEALEPIYRVCVYVKHGYFEYTVRDMGQALAHGEAIMSNKTYRHPVKGGVEILPVYKVKITGPGLESQYPDTFRRT